MKGFLSVAFAGVLLFALFISCGRTTESRAIVMVPVDQQRVQDQDDMTWADYNPIRY